MLCLPSLPAAEWHKCQKTKWCLSCRQFVATTLWPDGSMTKAVWLTVVCRRQHAALPPSPSSHCWATVSTYLVFCPTNMRRCRHGCRHDIPRYTSRRTKKRSQAVLKKAWQGCRLQTVVQMTLWSNGMPSCRHCCHFAVLYKIVDCGDRISLSSWATSGNKLWPLGRTDFFFFRGVIPPILVVAHS